MVQHSNFILTDARRIVAIKDVLACRSLSDAIDLFLEYMFPALFASPDGATFKFYPHRTRGNLIIPEVIISGIKMLSFIDVQGMDWQKLHCEQYRDSSFMVFILRNTPHEELNIQWKLSHKKDYLGLIATQDEVVLPLFSANSFKNILFNPKLTLFCEDDCEGGPRWTVLSQGLRGVCRTEIVRSDKYNWFSLSYSDEAIGFKVFSKSYLNKLLDSNPFPFANTLQDAANIELTLSILVGLISRSAVDIKALTGDQMRSIMFDKIRPRWTDRQKRICRLVIEFFLRGVLFTMLVYSIYNGYKSFDLSPFLQVAMYF